MYKLVTLSTFTLLCSLKYIFKSLKNFSQFNNYKIHLLEVFSSKVLVYSQSSAVSTSQVQNVCQNSLAVQWLSLCASNARGVAFIPGRGTKIHLAEGHGKKKKEHFHPSERNLIPMSHHINHWTNRDVPVYIFLILFVWLVGFGYPMCKILVSQPGPEPTPQQ